MVGASMSFPALPQRLHPCAPGDKVLSPVTPACNTSLPLLQERGYPALHLLSLQQGEHNVWELRELGNGLFWVLPELQQKNLELEFLSLKY